MKKAVLSFAGKRTKNLLGEGMKEEGEIAQNQPGAIASLPLNEQF